ncbi:MAG: transposase [Chloroflexi bacterium]|nr:transposase [Chloroflexota bacterium]
MPEYRRAYLEGGTYFFTVVTYKKRPILKDRPAIDLLWQCFQTASATHPFELDAFVILPDHLHAIWTLPDGDSDFSTRWRQIKSAFSLRYRGMPPEGLSESMLKKREKGVWQRRFWEHLIRDQADFNRHCDYVHYNPVKHGLVNSPMAWKHSSFEKFVERGLYSPDWGQVAPGELLRTDPE